MRDLIEAHFWAEHGHGFADAIDRLASDVRITFERLTARQYAAPWREIKIPPRQG